MKTNILIILQALLLSLLSCISAGAQIRGSVADARDGSPVQYADIILSDIEDKVISHTVSAEDGSFVLSAPASGKVIVTARMLGYDAYISEPVVLSGKAVDMGRILLNKAPEGLEEVVLVGEKNQIVYKLDRQKISASSSIASAGGTAIDVLATAPSFLVDAEGGLTFRGSSNFQVYVNGKLSPLEGSAALQSIPAASVEDIEILTTPSARYRTDGDGPIINVTTKKMDSDMWSGILNLSGTTLGGWSSDGTLNFRKGRNNFYIGGTAQHVKGRSDFNQTKVTTAQNPSDMHTIRTTSISDGQRWSDNCTMIGRAGWMYSHGRKHNLSVETQFGKTDNWRGGDMLYDETRSDVVAGSDSHAEYNAHDRYNLGKNLFQVSADYLWRPGEKSEIALTSRMRYDSYSIEYTESNLFDLSGERYEGTRGYEEEHHWDCDGSMSYKYNYSSKGNFELGYQYVTYSEHGGYRINYWNREAKEFQWQDDLATPFYYRRQVHSLYSMLTQTVGNFSFDAGVRADYVLDRMDIEIVDASRDIQRFNLFPSAHAAYDASEAGIFSAGYSYRTNRPGIWNLEPYITYEDYYTKKIGNPDIRPEYAHSAELGWRKVFSGGASLAVTGYWKYRRDISDWVRSALEPGVTLDQIVNAGNQSEKGLEVNSVLKPCKWWSGTVGGSLFHYNFKSIDVSCTDASGLHYFVNLLNSFTLAPKTKMQFDGHFVGPRILTQGSEKPYMYFNLAVRQSMFKERMTLALVGHDVFRTARYSNTRISPGLNSQTTVRPVYPSLVLSMSYNFNSSTHKSRSGSETELFEGKNF